MDERFDIFGHFYMPETKDLNCFMHEFCTGRRIYLKTTEEHKWGMNHKRS